MLVFVVLCVVACGRSSEERAYDEVRSTASLSKLREFFAEFPKSELGPPLAREAVTWCRRDPVEGCLEAIRNALPLPDPRYAELIRSLEGTGSSTAD